MLAKLAFLDFSIIKVFNLEILLVHPITVLGKGYLTIIWVLVFMVVAIACQFVPKYGRRL